MFAGHAAMGVALASFAGDARRRVSVLVVGASLAADLAWCVLTLASIEGGRSLGSQAFHQPRLPWSHSLVTTDLLALVLAAIGFAIGGTRVAVIVALAVLLHWLVGDVPFGEAFPLTPNGEPIATLHLYARWPIAFALELATIVVCCVLARRSLGTRFHFVTGGLLALHVLCWVPTFANAPAVDLDAAPARITVYLVMLLVAWGVSCAPLPWATRST